MNAVAQAVAERHAKRRSLDMHPCTSTLIEAYGYDPDELVLYINFRDGSRWRYLGVTDERFRAFLGADSKGRHLRSEINGKHDAERL